MVDRVKSQLAREARRTLSEEVWEADGLRTREPLCTRRKVPIGMPMVGGVVEGCQGKAMQGVVVLPDGRGA